MRLPSYPVMALAALAAAAGVACGSAASTYEELLATIPDTRETRMGVFIHDYALVRQLFDIPLPGPEDGEDAMEEFLPHIPPLERWGETYPAMYEPWLFGPFSRDRLSMTSEHFRYLGFDYRNMDQSIVTYLGSSQPAHLYQVIRGRFGPQATDKALASCSECEPPRREEHRGISYYSWGADYAIDEGSSFAPPAFDRLGRGGRIAVLDEYLFRTVGTSEMKGLIDAHHDEAPSLADAEEFRLLSKGMSQLGAYAMFLSDDASFFELDEQIHALLLDGGAEVSESEMERLLAELGPPLRPYAAYATGAGKDEEGGYMALALLHSDDVLPEENVGLLRRRIEEGTSIGNLVPGNLVPWSELIDVDTLEIQAEGPLLLAKLRGFAPLWMTWVDQRDTLITYEE